MKRMVQNLNPSESQIAQISKPKEIKKVFKNIIVTGKVIERSNEIVG